MASESLFLDVPPFPDNVPTASISTVSLKGLQAEDNDSNSSHDDLFDACQKLGFFLLDLRGDELGEKLMQEIEQIFNTTKELFDLPEHIKEECQHDPPRTFLGFKPRGCTNTESGAPDRFQWFNLGQDGLLGTLPLQSVPPPIHTRLPLFTSFLHHGQTLISLISHTLARKLSLPESTFRALMPLDKPSGTAIRIIKVEPSPVDADLRTSMGQHTDFGTITLLANVLGGLQILQEGEWKWVRPRAGCLVVNLGDAMVQWTGGGLKSNMHRVTYGPGEQRYRERYSVGLFVRPEKNASMKRLTVGSAADGGEEGAGEGDELTAFLWEAKKFMAMKRADYVLPGSVAVPVK